MPKRRPLLRPASPLQAQLRLVSLLDQLAAPSDRQRNPDELARRLGLPAATVPTLTRAGALWHHGKGRWHVPPSLNLPEVLEQVLPELWPRDFGRRVLSYQTITSEPEASPAMPALEPENITPGAPPSIPPHALELVTVEERLRRLEHLPKQLADLALYVSELERRVPGIQPSLFPEPKNITG